MIKGTDVVAYYWADPRITENIFSKLPQGGGGLMVWGGVCVRGKTPLTFIDRNTDGSQCVPSDRVCNAAID